MSKSKEDFKQEYGISDKSYIEQAYDAGQEWNEKADGGGLFAGIGNFIGNIWGDLTGKNAQMREMAQQEYLQEKQWEYDKPINEMIRQREAGINPLLASQGISQGNQSSAAPSVGAATPSDPIGAITGAAGNVAGAVKQFTDAEDIKATRQLRIDKLGADIASTLETAGFTKLQSMAMSTQLKYMDDKERVSYLNMLANLDNIKVDYELKKQQLSRFDRDMEKLDFEIQIAKETKDLVAQQTKEAEKRTLLLEKQAYEQEWNNKFMSEWNVNPKHSLVQNVLTHDIANGQQIGDIVFNYSKDVAEATQLGQNAANIENGFAASKEVAKGEQQAISEFGPANNVWRAIDKIIERKWPKPGDNDTEFDKYQAEIDKELKDVERAIYDASNAKDSDAVSKLKDIREVLRSKKRGSYQKVLDRYK